MESLPGIERVLDAEGKRDAGLDHPRSGELVAISRKDRWFSYYYWLDDERARDFARTVEIHRKPGYDPAELFLDPADPRVKLRAGAALARKKLVPAGPGTLPTHTPLFTAWLVGVVLLVGVLAFVPVLALGPIVEHLILFG